MERPVEEIFSEYANMVAVPFEHGVILEHHKPNLDKAPYHFHPSVEINYLKDCKLRYSFSGREVQLEERRIVVFWAAHPHRVIEVSGSGTITNAYVALSEFLQWSLPPELLNLLISGAVLISRTASQNDDEMAKRWGREANESGAAWHKMHAREIEARLVRLNVEGWDVLLEPMGQEAENPMGGAAVFQFERMLRFIANNFADQITVDDVAKVGNLSPNYAIAFFRKLMGRTIKSHIIDLRLSHAKMLLTATEQKISTVALDSGFQSQSAFYAAFEKRLGCSPASFRRGQRA